jgi:hypothetical protein
MLHLSGGRVVSARRQSNGVSGVIFRELDGAESYLRKLPETDEAELKQLFYENRMAIYNPSGIVEIDGGRCWGHYGGYLFTGAGDIVEEVLRDYWYAAIPTPTTRCWLPPIKRMSGTVAMLTAPYGPNNYGHWLIDIVPQFDLLQRAGVALVEIDYFIMHYASLPFQRETLATLGIPEEKILRASSRLHIQSDRMLGTTACCGPGASAVRKSGVGYVRRLFARPTGSSPGSRRLYISRLDAKSRRLTNEEQLIAALRPLGFECLSLTGVSIRETAALFQDAEWILGPTGSGLVNVMFGRQGGTLTELFSSGWVNFFHWILCDHIEYRYSGLRAAGRKVSRGEEMRYLLDDFEIAPQRVVQLLHKIGLS